MKKTAKTEAPVAINREDWLAALREVSHDTGPIADADDPSVMTTRQYAELGGIAESTARKQLQVLVERGRAVPVVTFTTGVGSSRRRVGAYRLLPIKETK